MDPKILAAAAKHFEKFYESEVFADILDNFASVCELLKVQPGNFVNFYPELKANLKSCRGMNLFKLLDERAGNQVFNDNMHAANTKMVVIGAGPIGLRTAIEAQLLGARVTVIEKRSSFTRNNVLHLWPWVIEDLKSLGAKNFYPRFCTGTMNHISIKRLQCILLKTALCFGVEVMGGVEFREVVEPVMDNDPWRISVKPENHALMTRGVDVLIGAEGKHVSLPGFRRKEFRGKLAIAITANFKNKRTTAEAIVEEISGVAFVYKQDFFNNLYEEFGIALENIVYYKDDTHYFVMTTKKHSLLDRKVLKKDLNDPMALLNPKNVNKDKLLEYIRDACDYCTDYQLPHLEFALNHHNEPDVALFDFTSMFASASACHVMEKKNRQLLLGLVGDGLLEPFWPTGTGIARGFLGALDAVWMVRQWASGDMSPLEIMEERESILKLLPQTTPENITKDFKNISIVPKTRYPNLPKHLYSSQQVRHLYNSDTPDNADLQRYQHVNFEEVTSKFQMRKARQPKAINVARIQRDPAEAKKSEVMNKQCDANANDFYQVMREKRKNDINNENERRDAPKAPVSQANNVPPMTLKERIEARRAALDKEDYANTKSKTGEEKNILNDVASKADFVRKMSKTFGYGMPSNAETKPDAITSEAEKCALLVNSSKKRENKANKPKRRKSGDQAKKPKSKPMSRERESAPNIQTWDFSNNNNKLHSSVAPIVPELDIEIDPELDYLLAELEQDEQFSKLCENDQKAWLESLFYQDTKHLAGRLGPRDKLNPAKSNPKNTLRVNQDSAARLGKDVNSPVTDPETVSAVHVNDKMKNLAQDFFSNKQNKAEKKSVPERKYSVPSSDVSKPQERKMSDSSFEITRPSTRKTSESTFEITKSDIAKLKKEESPLSTPSPAITRPSPRKMSDSSFEITRPSGRKMSDSSFEVTRPSARKMSESTFEITRPNVDKLKKEDSPLSIPSPSISRKSSITSYSTPPTSRKSSEIKDRDSTIDESCEEISGINKSLCSLAQSYFQSPQKPQPRKSSTVITKVEKEEVKTEDDEVDQKASLVASFFGPASNKRANSFKNQNKPSVNVKERISFEPESETLVNEEEDDEIELLIKAAENEKRASTASTTSSVAPPIPARSGDSRAVAMMKRLGNVTGILQGKH